ncbi:hypothetical protein [Mycolicibacterium iranicum]|uniref:Uncharacterized protein n=1 Tax=Mycolicibacterium iranicum TaxID=912594 RepID=A0ABT4HPX9_MYCIR|nr:hypothetical protein [Mycolicibacterium iranicum]MCZ0732220.1 hypothetical protein [Mycolicibacterium iranicum]
MTSTASPTWLREWRSTPIRPGRHEPVDAVRYHHAPVGIGPRAFRQGFARGGRDALRRLYAALPEDQRGLVAEIAADYEDDADD